VDLGLMYDPNRKLVWAADGESKVYAIRLDPGTAAMKEIK